ncbi:MFS transporter [Modicisalibacter luteus]|uniref:MFS transporter n=1 Tax=Modicisalibacter luteus TaxID=453962 RepID=A0ABV7LZF1_9GAMM|nr:MFS transporter [Halomonas lutea]GHB02138.1 MFS transporter [Halomonas lutea]
MSLLLRHPPILRLFLAQALYWSCAMIGILLTSLAGLALAPRESLATLPLALLMLGNLLAIQPLSQLMQRQGRRRGFQFGALAGVIGGLICALGIGQASFLLLCLGSMTLGIYQASAMYYRFAAVESVDVAFQGRATAYVIGGGVVAALIAPSLGSLSRHALATPYLGAYLLIAILALIALGILSGIPGNPVSSVSSVSSATSAPRVSRRQLLSRPIVRAAILTTAIGHGLMILVMNATPLAMSLHGLSLDASGQVIQWHMLGMFLPAFIAGPLTDRLGSRRVACIGACLLACSAAIALAGLDWAHFLLSSCLLGVGWNLMLVAGITLLGRGHTLAERASAQGLMELSNGSVAAVMSFASGALVTTLGWTAVNVGLLPFVALALIVQLGSTNRVPASGSASRPDPAE